MTRVIGLILAALMFMSCAYVDSMRGVQQDYYVSRTGVRVEIINPAEQCVLYKVLGANTTYYRTGLFVANYGALKAGFYTAEEADRELTIIEQAVDSKVATVGSIANTIVMVGAKSAKIGAPEVILVTQGLGDFAGDLTPIDDCTWYKLKAYIAKQRMLIYAFKTANFKLQQEALDFQKLFAKKE
jgi:hypothetical protein